MYTSKVKIRLTIHTPDRQTYYQLELYSHIDMINCSRLQEVEDSKGKGWDLTCNLEAD